MRRVEMEKYLRERTIKIANYIIKNQATVRQAGKEFGLHYSVISRDMQYRLLDIDLELYYAVRYVVYLHRYPSQSSQGA